MAKRYRAEYLQFRNMLGGSIRIGGQEDHDEEIIEEVAEEIGLSLCSYELSAVNVFERSVIPNSEVMTHDENGKTISIFGDFTWFLYDRHGKVISYSFGKNTSRRGIDFGDPLVVKLIYIQKLLLYVVWPNKNLTTPPLSPITLQNVARQNLDLIEWFYTEGWFLSSNYENRPSGKTMINAKIIHSKIESLIANGERYSIIDGYVKSIKRWLILGYKKYCPDWLKPKFTFNEVFTKKLSNEIAFYSLKNKGAWKAIEYDCLKPLFFTAHKYIEKYVLDIFWLEKQVEKAYRLGANSEYLPKTEVIHDGSLATDFFDEIVERDYQIDPETGKSWFEPEIVARDSEHRNPKTPDYLHYINYDSIRDKLAVLAGAAIFILLCFTGMRHGELVCLLVNALRIDGRELDCNGDLFKQIEDGKEFELIRTVFKLSRTPAGKTHITPIPQIAALAFVILFKVFEKGRSFIRFCDTRENYLLPDGGFVPLWREKSYGVAGSRGFICSVATYLKAFCLASGVEYQHPHRCRKTLATLLINEDPESLEIIRWLLAHESIEMTLQYIMSLPGVSTELAEYHKVHSSEKLIYFVAETLDGFAAGPAGNRAGDALLKNPQSWKGKMLAYSMKVLVHSYESANFTLHRTPAAWCIRYPTRVPRSAPCLPPTVQEAIINGEIDDGMSIHPRHEYCVPWLCGDAGHTRDDLAHVNRSLHFARQQNSKAGNAKERAHYEQQLNYWEGVLHQLKFGREDIGCHCFIESFVAGTAG